jgi:16S rRNA (cytosine967-C5)-methyltransferase
MSKSEVAPARAVAFDILLRVDQRSAYASELLHAEPAGRLSPPDHRLATELVLGVLRWRALLDSEIGKASSQPVEKLDAEVLTALRLGSCQLRFLERVPARAAIYESVELVKRARKRSAAPLVNAVLRKLSGESHSSAKRAHEWRTPSGESGHDDPVPVNAEELALTYSHPRWLVRRWVQAYGIDTARFICEYDQHRAPSAIRLRDSESEERLREEGVELAGGELVRSARRVVSGDVTRTRVFRERKIAVQDEASQLIAMLVGRGQKILDCCAAPGGKAAIMAERNPGALVIAVELHPHRARLLHRLADSPNVLVVSADARSLPFAGGFDRILVDVPCSGTGTLARNPDIKWRLKPQDLGELQARQVAILRAAVAQLAPGGRLIYSTCSLEQEENAQVVEKVLADDSLIRLIEAKNELDRLRAEGELAALPVDSIVSGAYLRTIPGVQPSDGFFAAILERATA